MLGGLDEFNRGFAIADYVKIHEKIVRPHGFANQKHVGWIVLGQKDIFECLAIRLLSRQREVKRRAFSGIGFDPNAPAINPRHCGKAPGQVLFLNIPSADEDA